jgi:hypothetical protein
MWPVINRRPTPRAAVVLYARVGGGAIGAFLTVSGALLLAAPAAGLAVFGLSEGGDGLLPAVGVRQFAFGLVILLLAVLREPRALAVVLLVGAAVPAVDGWLVWLSAGPMAAVRHLLAIPACVGLGALLWQGQTPNQALQQTPPPDVFP